jgi:hypothetical protein
MPVLSSQPTLPASLFAICALGRTLASLCPRLGSRRNARSLESADSAPIAV